MALLILFLALLQKDLPHSIRGFFVYFTRIFWKQTSVAIKHHEASKNYICMHDQTLYP